VFYAVYKVYRRDVHLAPLKIVRLLREVLILVLDTYSHIGI